MNTFQRIALVMIAVVVVSCASANAPQKLDNFVDNTELNCDKYNADDWQKSMTQYEKLVEEFNGSDKEYSEAEKQMAARAMGRYHSLLIKKDVELSAGYLNELKSILPSYLEGLVDGLDENGKSIGKSLEDLFNSEELGKTFEGIGAKLEEIFGNLGEE